MKDQHKLITGYRDLSQAQIDVMNKIKASGNELHELITELEGLDFADKRWIAIGKTDLQKGIMELVRSIAQPTSF